MEEIENKEMSLYKWCKYHQDKVKQEYEEICKTAKIEKSIDTDNHRAFSSALEGRSKAMSMIKRKYNWEEIRRLLSFKKNTYTLNAIINLCLDGRLTREQARELAMEKLNKREKELLIRETDIYKTRERIFNQSKNIDT